MAIAYRPPGVSVEEVFSPSANPLLAAPATVCLVGEARGYVQRTDRVALTNQDRIALPNFPRDSATLVSPVLSVTNVEEITPYETGDYEVNYDDAVDEIQQITLAGATGGTFRLTFKDEETADIAWNASAAAVETSLKNLSNVEAADLTVSGNAGGPYTVTFSGQYANTNLDNLKVNTGSLIGTNPAAQVHTVANGGVTGTIRRSDTSAIPEGATVTVVYRYLPEFYYQPIRIETQSLVEEFYGPAYDELGNIVSPLALATQIAFENGARDVVVQALFRRTDDSDPTSVRVQPTPVEVQEVATWEQSLYALRDIEDINLIVPVIGQSYPGQSDAEQLSVFQALANHIEFMKGEQQHIMAIVGEDSSASNTVAQANSIRGHAQVLRESRAGGVAENFIFVSPSKFGRSNPRTDTTFYVGGQYVATAIAGLLASGPVASSITRSSISGFSEVADARSKADKNVDAQNGLTVIEQRGTAVQIRHAITLDSTSAARREVPVVRAKHRMIESVRDTLEQQIIGRVIADASAPTVVAATVSGVLTRLVDEKDIVDFRDVQARTLSYDPTTVEVRFSYKPAYPLNYVNISFAIDLTEGAVETV